jgi:DNA integrity scanning protein DisA with diadenylate cyclase activity
MLLIKATLDTVIYFLIIRFCLAASHEIRAVRPHLSEIANVVVLAGCALVSTLAYSGYQDVFAAVAPAQSELYNWLFLVIVLAPIAMIVVIVARRLDFFTNLMFGKLNAVAIQQTAFAAAPQPPPGPAPDLDTSREIRDRVSSIERKVESAKAEAEKLRARNALGTETADSVAKMQGYRDGALAAIEKEDWAGARHFSDWAEYEASRVLADAINGDARLP